MPSLADIPLEVLIDNLLPLIPLKDILSLGSTNKEFASLCSDDTFWKRKLEVDYNFSGGSNARTKGYKFLYKGIHRSKVYVWGSAGEDRLGLGRLPNVRGILRGGMPYPAQLKVPGPRIVDLAACGWSFHALDSEGSIHVWGQLNGEAGMGLNADSFAYVTKRAAFPTKLNLPEKMTKISCGRAHATALSSRNRVWLFTSWGRPCVLTSPLLSRIHEDSTPRQVECGWSFSAVLTQGGDVYTWLPFEGEFGEIINNHDRETDDNGIEPVEDHDGVVQCRPWEINASPKLVKAVSISLPKLRGEDEDVGDKVIKIAAGDNFIIGLTEGGHVLKTDKHNGAVGSIGSHQQPKWEYLPQFSEVEHVRAHPTFSQASAESSRTPLNPPETLKITHISAHFLTFFAYSTGSSSIILRGTETTGPESQPDIQPLLQYRDVISVVLGDYHFGALTATGKLLTWGAYSNGALGLGDPTQLAVGTPGGYDREDMRERARQLRFSPPDVTEPTEVKFGTKNRGKGRESFVFGATASGWHTGALVIDLEDTEEEEEVGEKADESSPDNTSRLGWGVRLPFRVGLAGARGR